MKTLFEFMLVVPVWAKAEAAGEGEGAGVGLGDGGAGARDLQTDGCPEQVYPLCI